MPSMDTPSYSGTHHLLQPVLTSGCVAFLGWLVKSTPGTFWVVLPIWSRHLFSCVRAPASYYLSFNSPPLPRFLPSSLLFVGTLHISRTAGRWCVFQSSPFYLSFTCEFLAFGSLSWWQRGFVFLLHSYFTFFFFSEFLFGKVPYSHTIFITLTGF